MIFYLILSPFVSCIPTGQHSVRVPYEERKIEIPTWFIQKPKISGLDLSYAYCSQYNDKERELNELLMSAAKNFKIANQTRMIIMQEGLIHADRTIGGTQVTECEVSFDKNNLSDNYKIISQFPVGKGILAIAAKTSQLKMGFIPKFTNRLKVLDNYSPPKWAITPPSKKGYVYGLGLAPDYSSPEKAWSVAEQNARADIVFQKIVNILDYEGFNQATDFSLQENKGKAWASCILKNVSIIKHGYCKREKTYYALARMKEADMKFLN